jgi:hypothetical protein
LDTVYTEFQNDDLQTTNQPGQVEIQGNTVGIQIYSSAPSDFAALDAKAERLGLQVTPKLTTSDSVVGYLPIANLPTIAQVAGAPFDHADPVPTVALSYLETLHRVRKSVCLEHRADGFPDFFHLRSRPSALFIFGDRCRNMMGQSR